MGLFERARNRLLDAVLATNAGRKAAMRAAARMGNGLVYRNLGDHALIVDSGELIGRVVLKDGHFARDLFTSALAHLEGNGLLRRGRAFVDVGANIGTHTIYADRSGAFSRSVALEPDPATFQLLAANIALNGIGARAAALNIGAGETTATLKLARVAENSGAATLRAAAGATASVDVPVRRLDDVLKEAGIGGGDIGLLWIDVEGYEPEVWRGMPVTLSALPPIVLEFSPSLYGAVATRGFIAAIFATYPSVQRIDAGGVAAVSADDLLGVPGQIDLLLSR